MYLWQGMFKNPNLNSTSFLNVPLTSYLRAFEKSSEIWKLSKQRNQYKIELEIRENSFPWFHKSNQTIPSPSCRIKFKSKTYRNSSEALQTRRDVISIQLLDFSNPISWVSDYKSLNFSLSRTYVKRKKCRFAFSDIYSEITENLNLIGPSFAHKSV